MGNNQKLYRNANDNNKIINALMTVIVFMQTNMTLILAQFLDTPVSL